MNWSRASFLGSAIILLVGLGYLIRKSVLFSDPTVDYQFIWLAGEMWSMGLNPYSDTYFSLGQEWFASTVHPPKVWFYPPNWWPVARLVALTSFETGIVLWRGLSAICLVAGILVVAGFYRSHVAKPDATRVNITLAFVCLMSATPIALSLGQTTFLSFLGLSLFLAAYLAGNGFVMAVGLFLLMMKPQIGLPFCLFLLAGQRWFPTLAGAAVLSILAALPAFFYVGLGEFLGTYVDQFSYHNDMAPNHPREMTGLRNLGHDLFAARLSTLPLTLLASGIAFFLGIVPSTSGAHRAVKLCLLLSMIVLVVPLHTYDMIVLAPLILLVAPMRLAAQVVIFAGLFLIFRANNLAELTGYYDSQTVYFIGSRMTSTGLLIVLGGAAIGGSGLFGARVSKSSQRAIPKGRSEVWPRLLRWNRTRKLWRLSASNLMIALFGRQQKWNRILGELLLLQRWKRKPAWSFIAIVRTWRMGVCPTCPSVQLGALKLDRWTSWTGSHIDSGSGVSRYRP